MFITQFEPFSGTGGLGNRVFRNYYRNKDENDDLAFVPKVNTRVDESSYYLDMDLPGIEKEKIQINLKDNILTVSGERNFKEEVQEENYHRVETHFGTFSRSFSLPEDVDTEKINAKNENGVLEIVLPKLEQMIEKTKQIQIT